MKILTTFRVKEEKRSELIKANQDDNFFFFSNITEAESDIEDAEILITYGEDLTPIHIEQAKKLRWIMVMSAGMEKMPFKEIKSKNIMVTNARGIHKIPMAEYTLGMILQVSKQTKLLYGQEKEGKWNRFIQTSEVFGKTILIIGVGAIGGQIAKLCKAFGMTVLGISKSGVQSKYIDHIGSTNELIDLLPQADFIVSVLPSTMETKYMLSREHFMKMKDSSVFINIGRGDVVEESILINALEDQLIAHAVLDVFENEPLSADHVFWEMENVTVTPHISSITSNYLPRAFQIFEENLNIYKSKKLNFINLIDLERGY